MIAINKLIASYPRRRPDLPISHQLIFRREYKAALEGKTFFTALSRFADGWMHRRVAVGHGIGATLELGAGSLNHLSYEEEGGVLTQYDIVEPREYLYSSNPKFSAIRARYKDITEVPEKNRYHRIISVAVLEHLEDLPFAIAYSGLLLKNGGELQHGIPSEGAALWGAAWRLTTGLSYRVRNGLPYGKVMRHEHINSAPEILSIIREFYDKVRVARFPFPLFHGSLFTYLYASQPKIDKCEAYLACRKTTS